MGEPKEYEGLTETQLTTFKEAFSIFDKQQQGYIPFADFPPLWRSIGQNPRSLPTCAGM